jgi:hypothetical protein
VPLYVNKLLGVVLHPTHRLALQRTHRVPHHVCKNSHAHAVYKKLENIMLGSRKPANLLVIVGNFLRVVKGDPVEGGVTHMTKPGSQ